MAQQHGEALERENTAHSCTAHLDDLHVRLLGVKKTRQQLLAASGMSVFDCEVSDWVPSPCSARCGGGTRFITRQVIAKPDGGAECPLLSREEPCNQDPCDVVDCVMTEWSAWTACDHVQTRMRSVEREPSENGTPCGTATQSRMCQDGDASTCNLGLWSDWSGCSRACGGGVKLRTRGKSEGCSAATPTERQELCNREACAAGAKCAAGGDSSKVLFILDGSGSLHQEGFDALKELLVKTAARMEDAGRIASPAVLLAGDEIDTVSTIGAVNALKWPESITTLPAALGHATSLGASVVVVLTDGEPNSVHAMMEASHHVRDVMRLVFVTSKAHKVADFASVPTHDNVLELDPFEYRDTAVDVLVSMLCPQLE
jgi:hypothetical protein